ncbi:MAG: glycoside hydrolase family 5 protein [Bacteroidales bacterium]
MKRIFLLPAILFSAVILCAQPVKQHGALSVTGVQLTDQNGKPVVLHGVSFGWHNWWPRFYNENTVKWLAEDWKCTVVRAAMGVEPVKGYIQDPAGSKEKIEAVVNAAIANEIYVLIDWHSHGLRQAEAVAFFGEMAQKYGKYPHVIYEIFNEPDKNTWPEVKNYSIEVIKKIREYDPDNVILVGNPHWDQDIHLVADDPIQGFSNLMYTVHFYAATHGKSLRDRSDYAISKGIPVFVSECAGMSANGDGPIDYAAWNQWTEWMDKNSISWVAWSIADKNESCSMLLPSASSRGKWKEKDMKEWGNKTREFIRAYVSKK